MGDQDQENFTDLSTNVGGDAPSNREFNTLTAITLGVAVVCGLAFITLLIDIFINKQEKIEYLRNENQQLKEDFIRLDAKFDFILREIERNETVNSPQVEG